jgi:multidrug transporter EmrE-like cation transporter
MIRFLMALTVVLLGATGQVLMKFGAQKLGQVPLSSQGVIDALIKIVFIPQIPIGLFLWAMAAFLWLGVLTRVELSYAYPIFSLSFVLIALASWLIFKETLTFWRVAGILIICLGITVMYRT